MPSKFEDVPYSPFYKGERLGRAADFTLAGERYRQLISRRNQYFRDNAETNPEFNYKHDNQEDDSFNLVDSAKSRKLQAMRRGYRGPQRGNWNNNNRRNNQKQGPQHHRNAQAQQSGKRRMDKLNKARQQSSVRNRFRRDDNKVERKPSVQVQSTWEVIEQFDLSQLTKMQSNKPETEDLGGYGFLDAYDETYDRVSSKADKTLQRADTKDFYYVTTTDDPVIEELATKGAGTVFATDSILSHLMASPRSVYPWDIVAQRVGNALFFDKRDDSTFDLLTVNETAVEPPNTNRFNNRNPEPPTAAEAINLPERLSIEATMINQNFSQQVLRKGKGSRTHFENENPFFDEEDAEEGKEPASVGYKYRRFTFADGVKVVARCELHGTMTKKGKENLITCYSLNEWDSKAVGTVDWRSKVDSQRGSVLATELKNNSCKLAKWTAQSLLAGADQMAIGFVTRKNKKDANNHKILGTQFYKPKEFAKQITLSQTNMWGILKMLVDLFMSHPEGKYLLVRDPNKPILRVYKVPQDTFEESDDEDAGEEAAAPTKAE